MLALPSWYNKPMRWAQLTLVENDPAVYDLGFWLDYFKRTHSQAACISAGGCIAYYPTDVPFHYRSKYLNGTDPFGDLVKGCRDMGMVVLARTDPHACHADMFHAHPDWMAVDAQGNRRRHHSHPDYYLPCAFGPYAEKFMTSITKEIAQRYRVDGFFCNRWDGPGICYCEHCQAQFKAYCGLELPRDTDPRNPARRGYLRWIQHRLFELWEMWDREIQQIDPDCRFIPNVGGGALSIMDMATVGSRAPMLVADRQSRHNLMLPWANGKNAKEYRAALGIDKPVIGCFCVGIDDAHRWKDSVQSKEEIRIWVLDGLAQGLRPWFTKFAGVVHDPRWLKPVEDLYTWHHRNESYFRHTENLARVAIVYSQQTALFYAGDKAQQKVEDAINGFYQAMVEARIPFEMVHDHLLDAAHIDRYKLLILPNVACLSDAQVDQIRAYIARGGSVLATLETSICDENGERRKDFALADLFGVSCAGPVDGPMKNAYLRLNHATHHPVLASLEDAPRIIHAGHRIPVKMLVEFPNPPVTLIPSYPDLPMEEVYPRGERPDQPELFLREMPNGARVAYFNNDMDRIFWDILCSDHLALLVNTIRWATNEEPRVTVTGPGMLDLAVWRQASSLTVYLVNLTNPMAMKAPYREFLPTPPQKVRLRLPAGVQVRKVHLLVSDAPISPQITTTHVEVTLPSILDHEVLAIDFQPE